MGVININSEGQSGAESEFNFKEKRKWQIALRRYVLQLNKSSSYASYFGIDVQGFRKWIELQFDDELNWDNFSSAWQFDHIVPVAFFNLSKEDDLKLCWNFVNIGIEKLGADKSKGLKRDVFAAKAYFEILFKESGYVVCQKMMAFIDTIHLSDMQPKEQQQAFIRNNKDYLENLGAFSVYDFEKLNSGITAEEIIKEHEFLKKFG